ncbi:39S ribosomal protein L48, mitochondrial isoform X2 [Tachyglossus aculeatus]|uniref:39S ribosomal protein L48, mitochondrial isoform X2 n=1 Tax=Tachyglossus aculeatus TaxID=9261 RepID=UPI0018F565F8|nr:39S ribosomal protein L48, mitochondrial isoform X2 [Tachyglossus aculeatus]
MNRTLGKVLCLRNDAFSHQVRSLERFRQAREDPACRAGGILLSSLRHHRSRPTHGIGRYKHLLLPEEPAKKKKPGQVEVQPTDSEYGVLNIHLTAYDMTLVESYSKYIHNLCNQLSIKVEESYAMPTKTTEVMLLQEQGSKLYLDSVLTTHERVVQHSEEDTKGRFKSRPELEELLAKLN